MAEIPVSGEVLEWARTFRGLSLQDASDRIGIATDELQAYEKGDRLPTLTKFEKLAAVYCLPQATLFRRTKPEVIALPIDYRTVAGDHPQQGFDFRVAVSNVRTLQRTLRLLSEEDDEFRRAQLRSYDLLLGDDARDQADRQGEAERKAIGVPTETQLAWDSDDGFRHWRAIIETLGVGVYLQKFSVSDCRGLSLWDDSGIPAVIVNKDDRSQNAWVFTLIHEYAHLLLRHPGISDLDDRNEVEAYCNTFAAAFLMPRDALRAVLPRWPNEAVEWEPKIIYKSARQLKVSAQALAIRLETVGVAPRGFSTRFESAGPPKRKGAPGGNYVATRLSELGGRFVSSVISALDRSVLDDVGASQALGLPTGHIDKARNYVRRQLELASVG